MLLNQSHQEGLQLLSVATRMFEIIKSQCPDVMRNNTDYWYQGLTKVNEEAIRNMSRKNILFHEIEKKKKSHC